MGENLIMEKNNTGRKRLVVLTGAGISAESGLRTFRDGNGLWEDFKVEEVASRLAWHRNPELVLRFYNQRRKDVLQAAPNAAHYGLTALEEQYDVHIITQNIDDLHERAGSTNVLHLHGEIMKMRSVNNENHLLPYDRDIQNGDLGEDGGQLRPHIVWFGEPVPMIEPAMALVTTADLFVLVGSSLAVYPAAGLLEYIPDEIPKYIIDKVIPAVSYKNIIPIEKTATEGMAELCRLLL